MKVLPNTDGFGAKITEVDLTNPLSAGQVTDIRAAWLKHQVVFFPEQLMSHDDLERFTQYLGDWGDDPYVKSLEGHEHILAIKREAKEKASPFGGAWHSDWSFQAKPPAATILHAKTIPPVGGDTWYANGYAAFNALDDQTKQQISTLTAIHSARRPYSHEGFLAGGGNERSMTILPSDKAMETQEHPMVRTHPETGRQALWINVVYTLKIKELDEEASRNLLATLFAHSVQDRFLYKHKWAVNMLTLWDNRCVQHCAQGGYDGYDRLLHRTTVAGDQPYAGHASAATV